MLQNLGYVWFGDLIEDALEIVYEQGNRLTPDVRGYASTTAFTDRVIETALMLDAKRGKQ